MSAQTNAPTARPRHGAGPFGEPYPWVYVDGDHVSLDDARVSIHANVISYGTGTFEGIRASWNPDREALYLLEPEAHYERMQRSARVLGLGLPASPPELVTASIELLQHNGVREDAYLRPLYVLAGEHLPVHMHAIRTQLSIAATPVVGDYVSLRGLRCCVSTWRRAPDVVLPSRAKICGSYVGPALAKSEAVARGYDEAIMLNCADRVTEGTTSNVFLRHGEQWLTPAANEDILEGITRAQVMRLLEEATGRPVAERGIHRSELLVADELLLCGTAALVAPVIEVDGRPVGDGAPGEQSLQLLADLRAIARRANDRHHEWTTPVPDVGGGR